METLLNAKCPEFKLNAFFGNEFTTVSNYDIAGKWTVFFFYPADFTFVCSTDLVDLADKHDKLLSMGVSVYSVSCDTEYAHKEWHDSSDSIKKIKYPMIADPIGILSKAFGVYMDNTGMACRSTFVINPEGMVKIIEINDNNIGRNADELIRKIEAAQFVASHPGDVCPAKWKQGDKAIKPDISHVEKI
jgi:peroxiredoxin (alkyl hydroperoxide reductase subunit C)